MRTRFAPSPTGQLHVGGARTAILNWLLARRHGGSFVLRIEDTDLGRNVEGTETHILDDLRWLGLDWDEGPDVGGPFAPYRQSESGEIYAERAHHLLKEGLAYRCTCPPSQGAEGQGAPERCTCANSSDRSAEDGPASLRFRVPNGDSVTVEDVVRGPVVFPMESIEDFVLLRSDGRPTYNFAAVVDDYRMRITHVIRGTDHLINTPKQILLYRAFGYELPSFAHIPLILGTDRQKLSKRHGATSVGEHRRLGYMPEALLNYLSLLSWSSPSGEELLSREQLAAEVALDRVGASDAIFDRDKLRWLSSRYIQQLPLETLVERLGPFVDRERFPIAVNRFPIAVAAVRDKLSVLSEINDHLEVFTPRLSDAQTAAREILLADPGTRAVVLDAVRERLTGLPEWDDAAIGAAVRAAGKDVGARGRELFLPVRLAITGEEHGSDLGKIAAVLGRELVLRRLGPEVLRSDSFDVS